MRSLLLTAAMLIACAGGLFAQNLPPDYNWEVGFNGGFSVATRPLGPAETYQGRRTEKSHDFSLHLNYFVSPHWMLNADAGERRWESFDNWKLNDLFGQTLQARQVNILVADHAISESIGINYVLPFYSRYNNYNKSNIYFGVMFGLVQTVNDGSTGYSVYGKAPDSAYTYVSGVHYGAGLGYNFGLKIGYTYYIIPRLGVNIELGARYAHIKTDDTRWAGINSKYYLLYFPETIGISWRF